jgi:hypothetical protein
MTKESDTPESDAPVADAPVADAPEQTRQQLRQKLRQKLYSRRLGRAPVTVKNNIIDKGLKRSGIDPEKFREAIKTLNMDSNVNALLSKER